MPRRSVRLAVGGLTLHIKHPRATAALDPPRAYEPFVVSRGADMRLELKLEAPPQPRPEHLLFDSGGPWRVHRFKRGFLYTFCATGASPAVYKAAWLDARHVAGTIYLPRQAGRRQPRFAAAYQLDELLFYHRLALEGAIVLHAAGPAHRRGAVLLCGASGAGKSTLARLWRRSRPRDSVLSDDRIVMWPSRQGVRSYGTPWHGEARLAAPKSSSTAAVFFLRQGSRTRVRRLTWPTATALLMARSFPPIWNRSVVSRALDTCRRVARRLPAYELTFRPNSKALEAT